MKSSSTNSQMQIFALSCLKFPLKTIVDWFSGWYLDLDQVNYGLASVPSVVRSSISFNFKFKIRIQRSLNRNCTVLVMSPTVVYDVERMLTLKVADKKFRLKKRVFVVLCLTFS